MPLSARGLSNFRFMKVLRQDPTPNPDALKFVLDGQIVSAGSRSFRDRVLCEDPVAKALFEVEEVLSIFFVSNVVTVTKDPFGDWGLLVPRLTQVIESATEGLDVSVPKPVSPLASRPAAEGVSTSADPQFFERTYEEKVAAINNVFDQYVRGGLASDGGGLSLIEVVERAVRIEYHGACGSCPSSTSGTLYYIEDILRTHLHPDLYVELV